MQGKFFGITDYDSGGYSMHTTKELVDWILDRNANQKVDIRKIPLTDCAPWFYDGQLGMIRNRDMTFFQIAGTEQVLSGGEIIAQPIILQKEIGYLGIAACRIHGVWHFLLQAKIEPGNINCVQISPTIQATKSNFTRKHGGRAPAYLDIFVNVKQEDVLVDQIQSEQSSRFMGKRNRNLIIRIDEPIQETPNHRWMTLPQLRELMKYDNLVNMDTRTVFSCLPYCFLREEVTDYEPSYIRSLYEVDRQTVISIYQKINNYKMFDAPQIRQVPLLSLPDWQMEDGVFRNIKGYPFEIIFCEMEIEGREVTRWNQPLFAALGIATFGLICCREDGVLKVLVKCKPEVGCFDSMELGPSVQEEFGTREPRDQVAKFFYQAQGNKDGVLVDVLLSEEGGRFYHEQNRNTIIVVDKAAIPEEEGYVWCSFGTLNALVQVNNCLNIQLRNLLMLLSMYSAK